MYMISQAQVHALGDRQPLLTKEEDRLHGGTSSFAGVKKLNKTDPRTRMHSTKNQSKTLIIDLDQRQESATPSNDLCRLLSSLILVDKSYQRLLSTTRVNNMKRRDKT